MSPATEADDTARLYVSIGRLWRALRRDASGSAIGHGGLSVLATLIAEGPQRPGTLAQIEGVTAPAMTRIVNALEGFGYVERRPDPDDGRASVVVATPDGEALVLQGRAARLHALRDRFDRLDQDQQHLLRAALGALDALAED